MNDLDSRIRLSINKTASEKMKQSRATSTSNCRLSRIYYEILKKNVTQKSTQYTLKNVLQNKCKKSLHILCTLITLKFVIPFPLEKSITLYAPESMAQVLSIHNFRIGTCGPSIKN